MSNITFLSTALPPIVWESIPEITYEQFQDLLNDNLSKQDLEQAEVIQRLIDLENLRCLWKKEKLNPKGKFNALTLEEAIVTRTGFPFYVNDFLDMYTSTEKRVHFFPKLLVDYFAEEETRASGFLKKYLGFERKWRIVLAALRAKELKRDLLEELQFEDVNDAFISRILAQKDALTFDPEAPFDALVPMYQQAKDKPFQFYQDLAAWRFEKIEGFIGVDTISLEKVLGYMARLITALDYTEMDQKSGDKMIEKACALEIK
jgi:hypothetical protein